MKERRSLYNFERGSDLVKTEEEVFRFKLWSPVHAEFELYNPPSGRASVLHYLIRPEKKYVIGGSLVDMYDEFLTWSFSDFVNLDAGFPLTARLFASTFSGERKDAFLSRAIEPYSGEVHWFLCAEGDNFGSDKLTESVIEQELEKNKTLPEHMAGIVLLADKIIDDLNPSFLQTLWRGIGWGNRKIVIPALLGQISDRIASTPKWVEMAERVADLGEKINSYENRFCVDDLYNGFAK
jgi:hypothetical protein